MKHILLTLLLFLIASSIIAQNQLLTGTVVERGTQLPVPGVIVFLKNTQGKMVSYATTVSSGKYSVNVSNKGVGDSLHFSMLGYKTLALPATNNLLVEMQEETLNIREVIVRAPKVSMRGDTVRYNVSSFAESQDKNIGDVLKKMPGIEIGSSGQIKYNGKPINNFYIEGSDILDGRYGIATNNITPKDVKSIEVLENHQSIKALKDIHRPEEAAINLKLHDGAKAKWVGTADLNMGAAAAGNTTLWNGNLFGMRMGKNWQSIESLKLNNTGVNLRHELSSFSSDYSYNTVGYRLEDHISVGVSNAPLDEKRVRFNNSLLASTTNSWKINQDLKLKTQVNYLYDRLTSSNKSQTTYFFQDSTSSILESQSALSSTHNISGNIELQANTEKYFLKNNLDATLNWHSSEVSTLGSYPNIQNVDIPSYEIKNDFKYIRRFGKHSLTLASFNQYASNPQTLVIDDAQPRSQKVLLDAFYSNTYIDYGLNFKKYWSFNLKSDLSFLGRNLDSNLEMTDTTLVNNITSGYSRISARPSLTYTDNSFKATLNLPIDYYKYKVNAARHNDLVLVPSMFLRYNMTAKFSIYTGASIGHQPINIGNFYSAPIMTNYRYLREGIDDFSMNLMKSVNAGLLYKDPINSFSVGANMSRSWNDLTHLPQDKFLGEYIVSSKVLYANELKSWYASVYGSAGIYAINGLVGLNLSYSHSNAQMLQNQELTPYESTLLRISPKFNGRLAPWLLCDYIFNYNYSKLNLSKNSEINQKNSFNHSLSLTFTPINKLDIVLSAEHYYTELTDTQNKNLVLADLDLEYNLTDKLRLKASVSNILNQKTYTYTIFNQLSSFTSEYQIRPLNFLLGVYLSF